MGATLAAGSTGFSVCAGGAGEAGDNVGRRGVHAGPEFVAVGTRQFALPLLPFHLVEPVAMNSWRNMVATFEDAAQYQ
jgi:hypothetical protein